MGCPADIEFIRRLHGWQVAQRGVERICVRIPGRRPRPHSSSLEKAKKPGPAVRRSRVGIVDTGVRRYDKAAWSEASALINRRMRLPKDAIAKGCD